MGSEIHQLINDDGEYQMEAFGDLAGMSAYGKDFRCLSILGCQSSGKSTLLNLLFGFDFKVLDAAGGRRQTTRGVWVGSCEGSRTIVMDVEGTDGAERGEEERPFERRTSLLSLALAQVLVVNMWAHDVGRQEAANYGLLKTVFEQALLLFGEKFDHKTCIVFVFRDHVEKQTSLDALASTIRTGMAAVFSDLKKPANFKDAKVTDLFDFAFHSLPHKLLMEEEFMAAVAHLKKRLVDPSQPDFLAPGLTPDVDAADWPQYGKGIWDTICSSRDLDLPTQREVLALVRCDEFAEAEMRNLLEVVEGMRSKLDAHASKPIEGLGAALEEVCAGAIANYDENTARYVDHIVAEKRTDLRKRMETAIRSIVTRQVAVVMQTTRREVEERCAGLVARFAGCTWSQLADPDTEVPSLPSVDTIQGAFSAQVEDAIPASVTLSFAVEGEEVAAMAQQLIARCKEDLGREAMQRLAPTLTKRLSQPVKRLMERVDEDVWSQCRSLLAKVKEKVLVEAEHIYSAIDIDIPAEGLQEVLEGAVRTPLETIASTAPVHMERVFRNHFSIDEDGVPRRFVPGMEIATLFKSSVDKAEAALAIWSLMRLDSRLDGVEVDSEEVEEKYVILSADDGKSALEDFKRSAQAAYMSAVNEQERALSGGGISLGVIILIAVLGFNEFIMILTNPIYLFLAILLGGIGGAVYMSGYSNQVLSILSVVLSNSITAASRNIAAPKPKSD